MSGSTFPGRTVIDSFLGTEADLATCLKVIPYSAKHLKVWSPKLTTVILEASSQLDSLWRQIGSTRALPTRRQDANITDYYRWFSADTKRQWAVLFAGDEPQVVRPFWNWRRAVGRLRWWDAYNALKHNRLLNREHGTLGNAVMAMSALFVAVMRSDECYPHVLNAGMVSLTPVAERPTISAINPHDYVVAESKLFAHPVNWCGIGVLPHHGWGGPASARFTRWFTEFSAKGRLP